MKLRIEEIFSLFNSETTKDYKSWKREYKRIIKYLNPRLKVMSEEELKLLFDDWTKIIIPKESMSIEIFSKYLLFAAINNFYSGNIILPNYLKIISYYKQENEFFIRIIMKSINFFAKNSNDCEYAFSQPIFLLNEWLKDIDLNFKFWPHITYIFKYSKKFIPDQIMKIIYQYWPSIFSIAYNLEGGLQDIFIKSLLHYLDYEGIKFYENNILFDLNRRCKVVKIQKVSQIYTLSILVKRHLEFERNDYSQSVKNLCEAWKQFYEIETEIKEVEKSLDSFVDLIINAKFDDFEKNQFFKFMVKHPSKNLYLFLNNFYNELDFSILKKYFFEEKKPNFVFKCNCIFCRFQFLDLIIQDKPNCCHLELPNKFQICSHFVDCIKNHPTLLSSSKKNEIIEMFLDYENDKESYEKEQVLKLIVDDFFIEENEKNKSDHVHDIKCMESIADVFEQYKNSKNFKIRELYINSFKMIKNDDERNKKLINFMLSEKDNVLRLKALENIQVNTRLAHNQIFYSFLYDESFKIRRKMVTIIPMLNTLNPFYENPIFQIYYSSIFDSLLNQDVDVNYSSKIASIAYMFSDHIYYCAECSKKYSKKLIETVIFILSDAFPPIPEHSSQQKLVLERPSPLLADNNIADSKSTNGNSINLFSNLDNENLLKNSSKIPTSKNMIKTSKNSINSNNLNSYQLAEKTLIESHNFSSSSLSNLSSIDVNKTDEKYCTGQTFSKLSIKEHLILAIDLPYLCKRDRYLLKILAKLGNMCENYISAILNIFYTILKRAQNNDLVYEAMITCRDFCLRTKDGLNLSILFPRLQKVLIYILNTTNNNNMKTAALQLIGSCFDSIYRTDKMQNSLFENYVINENHFLNKTKPNYNDFENQKVNSSSFYVDNLFISTRSLNFENHIKDMKIFAVVFESNQFDASLYANELALKIILLLKNLNSVKPNFMFHCLTLIMIKYPNEVLPSLGEIIYVYNKWICYHSCVKSLAILVQRLPIDFYLLFKSPYFNLLDRIALSSKKYFIWAVRFLSLAIFHLHMPIDLYFNSIVKIEILDAAEVLRSLEFLVQNVDATTLISPIITIAFRLLNQNQNKNQNQKLNIEEIIDLQNLFLSISKYQNINSQLMDFSVSHELYIKKDCEKEKVIKIISYNETYNSIIPKYIKPDFFFVKESHFKKYRHADFDKTENIPERDTESPKIEFKFESNCLFKKNKATVSTFITNLIEYSFKCTPINFLRVLTEIKNNMTYLATRLFPIAFLSIWEICSPEEQKLFSLILSEVLTTMEESNCDLMFFIEFMDSRGYLFDINYLDVVEKTESEYYRDIVLQRYYIYTNDDVPHYLFNKLFSMAQKLNKKDHFKAIFRKSKAYIDTLLAADSFLYLENWSSALELYQKADGPISKRIQCLFQLRKYDEIVDMYDAIINTKDSKEKRKSLHYLINVFLIRRENFRIENILENVNFLKKGKIMFSIITYFIRKGDFEKANEYSLIAFRKLHKFNFSGIDQSKNQEKLGILQLLCEMKEVIQIRTSNLFDSPVNIKKLWENRVKHFERNSLTWERLITTRSLVLPIHSNQSFYLSVMIELRKSGHFELIHHFFDKHIEQNTRMETLREMMMIYRDEGNINQAIFGCVSAVLHGLVSNLNEFIYLAVVNKMALPAMTLYNFNSTPLFGSELRDYITFYFEAESFDNAMLIFQELPLQDQQEFFAYMSLKFPVEFFAIFEYMNQKEFHFAEFCQLVGKYTHEFNTFESFRLFNAAILTNVNEKQYIKNWKGWAMENLVLFLDSNERYLVKSENSSEINSSCEFSDSSNKEKSGIKSRNSKEKLYVQSESSSPASLPHHKRNKNFKNDKLHKSQDIKNDTLEDPSDPLRANNRNLAFSQPENAMFGNRVLSQSPLSEASSSSNTLNNNDEYFYSNHQKIKYFDHIEKLLNGEADKIGADIIKKNVEYEFSTPEFSDKYKEMIKEYRNSLSGVYNVLPSTIENNPDIFALNIIESCLKIIGNCNEEESFEFLIQLFFALFAMPHQSKIGEELEEKIINLTPRFLVKMLPQITSHLSSELQIIEKLLIQASLVDFQSVYFSVNLHAKEKSTFANELLHRIINYKPLSDSEYSSLDSPINNKMTTSELKWQQKRMQHVRECEIFDIGMVKASQTIFERWKNALEEVLKDKSKADTILPELFEEFGALESELDELFLKNYRNVIRNCEQLYIKRTKDSMSKMWTILAPFYGSLKEAVNRLTSIVLQKTSPTLAYHTFQAMKIPGTIFYQGNYKSNCCCCCDSTHYCRFDDDENSLNTIEGTFKVLGTQQHPRSCNFITKKGTKVQFLLKANEDLRIDQRIMQFFHLLNVFFRHYYKRESLDITCYSVIPLRKDVGLIRYVINSMSILQIVTDMRESRYFSNININTNFPKINNKIEVGHENKHESEQKLNIDNKTNNENKVNGERNNKEMIAQKSLKVNSVTYEGELDQEFSSGNFYRMTKLQKYEFFNFVCERSKATEIFDIFFLRSGSSASCLSKIRHFSRSAALMSMVGHVIGLGDRHPSNILIDISTGVVIHIDFGDCFEAAQKRSNYPEKVPFRLTRMILNAVDGGISNGPFGATCVEVMKLIRKKKSSLAAQLTVFLKESKKKNSSIDRVIQKLSGNEFEKDIRYNVEDQAYKLIQIAEDPMNYCQHYPGWCPFW